MLSLNEKHTQEREEKVKKGHHLAEISPSELKYGNTN